MTDENAAGADQYADGTYASWQVEHLERAAIPSDTRLLEVIIARLSLPALAGRREVRLSESTWLRGP